jgi:hypothetical protein
MQDFESFRKRFKEMMEPLGLNNSQIADICDVSPNAIRDIVVGSSKDWGVSKLIKLLSFRSDLNPEWLLLGKGRMIKTDGLEFEKASYLALEKEKERLEEELSTLRTKYNRNNEKLINMQGQVISMQQEISDLKRKKGP